MDAFETRSAMPEKEAAAQIGDATGVPLRTAGFLDELSFGLASARATLSNFLDLLSLEARRAGLALTWMIVFAVIAAICIVTAWLGLMLALAMAAMALGISALAAVIAVALINGLCGAVLIYVSIGMSHDLLFSATRRQVAGQSSVKPPA